MSRLIPSALRTQLDSNEDQHVLMLCFLDFGPNSSDAAFLHTDVGDISFNPRLAAPFAGNQTFMGTGQLGNVFGIRENPSDRPDTYSLTLSGVDATLAGHVRTLSHKGRAAVVWLAAFNPDTGVLAGATELISGTMDVLEFVRDPRRGVADLSVVLLDERAKLSRGKGVYFSHTNQQDRHMGDLFFFGTARLEEKQVVWGKQNKPAGSGAGSYSGGGRGRGRDPYHHR